MTGRAKSRKTGVVLAATFALVFHLLISGFVDGAMASAEATGIVDVPICSTRSGTDTPHSPDQPGHPHLPDCCVLSCSVATGSALIDAAPVLLHSHTFHHVRLPLPAYHRPAQRLDRPPLNPRAPPAIA
jgi:hypothetical protein